MGANYCLVAAAILCTLPMLATAESSGVGNQVFSLGPRTIYSMPSDADQGQWSAGVQARIHMSLSLALEASMDARSNNFNKLTTIKTWPFQVSLLAYIFPGANLSPYLLGGAGWYYTQVDGPFSFNHADSRFGMHAGTGLEFMLNESISIDGSYRYVWLESVSSKDEYAIYKNYQDSGSMVTIALNFLF